MEITINRLELNPDCTCGEMLIDGQFAAHTLELPVKDGKPSSAVPPGLYGVVSYPSPKFGREMPLITGIPDRSEIEIHFGNSPEDSRGCILLGLTHDVGTSFIGESRLAFESFWQRFNDAKQRGEIVSIRINGGIPSSTHSEVQDATTGKA